MKISISCPNIFYIFERHTAPYTTKKSVNICQYQPLPHSLLNHQLIKEKKVYDALINS